MQTPNKSLAAFQRQTEVVRATRQPTTQPVVDAVVSPKDDATDTPPFARSVVPGAAPQSAASTDSAVSKAAEVAKAEPPDSAAGNSLTTPPVKTRRKRGKQTPSVPASDPQLLQVHEADPTASGQRSLVRALGLKIGRIVIDPGHGGHDAGTVGPDGIQEKDVTLDVGLRLGKLLRQRLGADVTFTRSTDTFVPLETRTAIANKAQADLFVSIHANSSRDSSARGVETYYLNFTSSPDALDVAARENAVSEKSIHELQDLVKKIAMKDKIDESKEFAGDVDHSLSQGLGQNGAARDRGVKKAPFVVLIGANMPSILTEIAFVSNPQDAHDLRDPAYRQRIAESLYAGIARYINGLSSVRVAEVTPHGAGN
jgi:N-acetylmuramoyl-L-alanine amidase